MDFVYFILSLLECAQLFIEPTLQVLIPTTPKEYYIIGRIVFNFDFVIIAQTKEDQVLSPAERILLFCLCTYIKKLQHN